MRLADRVTICAVIAKFKEDGIRYPSVWEFDENNGKVKRKLPYDEVRAMYQSENARRGQKGQIV